VVDGCGGTDPHTSHEEIFYHEHVMFERNIKVVSKNSHRESRKRRKTSCLREVLNVEGPEDTYPSEPYWTDGVLYHKPHVLSRL